MKILNNIKAMALAVVFAFVVFGLTGPITAYAATAPSLGAAATFGVLSSTFTNSNTSPQTIINGNVGYSVAGAPVTPPITVNGTLFPEDATWTLAGINQGTALGVLNGQACTDITIAPTTDLNAVIIGGNPAGTFPPGCYSVTGAMNIVTATTVTLDATALGGVGNVWIFKPAGALITGASTAGFPSVVLANGASAANVFWAPVGATTIGANFAPSATPTFVGTIIDNAGISLGHFANLLGRALDFATTVTTDANTITAPTTLTLNKVVINDNGGGALNTAWTLAAAGPTPISGITGSGNVTSATVTPGAYTLSESGGPAGYAASTYSCIKNGNPAVVSNSITLIAGDSATCTITNDDIASASITVVKIITNDNGRTKVFADFPLFVNGVSVARGVPTVFPAGAYVVTETTDPNYAQSFSGQCDATGHLSIAPGDSKTCIITNDDIAATAIPVYSAPVPPLIDVVKVPSPLALPAGPGSVAYTYTLRNMGTVPVTNITMVGDTCSPIILASGDTNADAKLDVNETWVYRCSTTLTKTHTNTVTATGWANGISAVDIASATVVVGVPVVPPLIHVTKIPSPLALSAKGGVVTYTEKITNPGTVALSNVRIADNKCSPLKYISGDINNNSKLESTETWTYTCKTSLTKTTTNTATASGEANGLTASDFAIATVVVANTVTTTKTVVPTKIPKLPNTGVAPTEKNIPWNIILPVGVLMLASASLVVARKKSKI